MFKNRSSDGKLNICGANIATLRKQMGISQRALADQLQLVGLDLTKNTIQQIESKKRFVTDIEIKQIANFFEVTVDYLLK